MSKNDMQFVVTLLLSIFAIAVGIAALVVSALAL